MEPLTTESSPQVKGAETSPTSPTFPTTPVSALAPAEATAQPTCEASTSSSSVTAPTIKPLTDVLSVPTSTDNLAKTAALQKATDMGERDEAGDPDLPPLLGDLVQHRRGLSGDHPLRSPKRPRAPSAPLPATDVGRTSAPTAVFKPVTPRQSESVSKAAAPTIEPTRLSQLVFEGVSNLNSLTGRMHGSLERLIEKTESLQSRIDKSDRQLQKHNDQLEGKLANWQATIGDHLDGITEFLDDFKEKTDQSLQVQSGVEKSQHRLAKIQDLILDNINAIYDQQKEMVHSADQGTASMTAEIVKLQQTVGRLSKDLNMEALAKETDAAEKQFNLRAVVELLRTMIRRGGEEVGLKDVSTEVTEFFHTFVPAAKDAVHFPSDRLTVTLQIVGQNTPDDDRLLFRSSEGSHVAQGYRFDVPINNKVLELLASLFAGSKPPKEESAGPSAEETAVMQPRNLGENASNENPA